MVFGLEFCLGALTAGSDRFGVVAVKGAGRLGVESDDIVLVNIVL